MTIAIKNGKIIRHINGEKGNKIFIRMNKMMIIIKIFSHLRTGIFFIPYNLLSFLVCKNNGRLYVIRNHKV